MFRLFKMSIVLKVVQLGTRTTRIPFKKNVLHSYEYNTFLIVAPSANNDLQIAIMQKKNLVLYPLPQSHLTTEALATHQVQASSPSSPSAGFEPPQPQSSEHDC